MDTIEKIMVLKKFIEQKGSCKGISCTPCKQTIFSHIKDNEDMECKEMHEILNIPYDSSSLAESRDITNTAIKELIRILEREHN